MCHFCVGEFSGQQKWRVRKYRRNCRYKCRATGGAPFYFVWLKSLCKYIYIYIYIYVYVYIYKSLCKYDCRNNRRAVVSVSLSVEGGLRVPSLKSPLPSPRTSQHYIVLRGIREALYYFLLLLFIFIIFSSLFECVCLNWKIFPHWMSERLLSLGAHQFRAPLKPLNTIECVLLVMYEGVSGRWWETPMMRHASLSDSYAVVLFCFCCVVFPWKYIHWLVDTINAFIRGGGRWGGEGMGGRDLPQ